MGKTNFPVPLFSFFNSRLGGNILLSSLCLQIFFLQGALAQTASTTPTSSSMAQNYDRKYQKSCDDVQCHPKTNPSGGPYHVPYLLGKCLACHEDHTSSAKGLLKPGGDKVCLSCHARTIADPSTGKVLHPTVNKGCVECHFPHVSRVRNLLRSEQELARCAECHADFLQKAAQRTFKHKFFDPKSQCGFCHYAHQRSDKKYLRENVSESCLTCHDLAISVDKRKLESVGERLRSAKVVHGAMRAEGCPACHTPHGSDQSSLLNPGYPAGNYATYQTEQYALCWKCHKSKLAESINAIGATNFRQGNTNLHRLHLSQLGQGRACHLCHAPHASDQPHLIRESLTFRNWQAPLRYQSTANGGSCTTACHKDKQYSKD